MGGVISYDVPEAPAEQIARFTELLGRAPDCSFESGEWDYPTFVLGPPHLMCDTHHQVAHGSVYVADPGQEVGLCTIQHERLVEKEQDLAYRSYREAEPSPAAV